MPPDEVLNRFVMHGGAFALAGLLGALFGSFANVCIYRLPPTDEHPKGRSVVMPASHCSACKTPIKWYDNLPLLSYLWLRGSCRACKAHFSPRYLLVEFLGAALFVLAYYLAMDRFVEFPVAQRLLVFSTYALYFFVLLVIAFIDLDHWLILDRVTYPSILVFFGLGVLLPGGDYKAGLIGAGVGYGLIWLISTVYYYVRGHEGMGLGDGKLLAIVGALFGWQAVVGALFIGSTIGPLVLIPLSLARSEIPPAPTDGDTAVEETVDEDEPQEERLMKKATPFGPFLVVGAIAYLVALPSIREFFWLLY